MSSDSLKIRLCPLALSLGLLALDQISKALVVAKMPLGQVFKSYFGDFLELIHVRNKGAAFSLGASSSPFLRVLILIVVPILVMGFVLFLIITPRNLLSNAQRWFAAGLLGGGLGTLCDRIFRFDQGVVDFISVKFYGLFGLERWPTFNLSDSFVVVFAILLAITLVFKKAPS